jgi:mono/diheme cytochrome c family protein
MIRSSEAMFKETIKKLARWLALPALAMASALPLVAITGTASVIVAIPTAALAQDEPRNISRGREVFRDKAKCQWCHGWDGGGGNSDMGFGPSLRDSYLDLEGIIEVVSCGRIGAEMPAHDSKAYEDDRCYGLTREDFEDPETIPTLGLAMLRASEIEMVAAFLMEWVVQKGPVTYEYCVPYHGAEARICQDLK